MLTLEPITQNGYFRRKADITCVLHGAITAEIANITSGCFEAILSRSDLVIWIKTIESGQLHRGVEITYDETIEVLLFYLPGHNRFEDLHVNSKWVSGVKDKNGLILIRRNYPS